MYTPQTIRISFLSTRNTLKQPADEPFMAILTVALVVSLGVGCQVQTGAEELHARPVGCGWQVQGVGVSGRV